MWVPFVLMLLSKLSCRRAGSCFWLLLSCRPRCGRGVDLCGCDGALEQNAMAFVALLSLSVGLCILLGEHDKTLNFNFMSLIFHSWTKACMEMLYPFIFKFEPSHDKLVIIICYTLFMLKIALCVVYWWYISCITVHVLNPGHVANTYWDYRIWLHFMWLYWSSDSRCGLARGVSRYEHVLTLVLMDWSIISSKPKPYATLPAMHPLSANGHFSNGQDTIIAIAYMDQSKASGRWCV